jgi:hypothetical protein
MYASCAAMQSLWPLALALPALGLFEPAVPQLTIWLALVALFCEVPRFEHDASTHSAGGEEDSYGKPHGCSGQAFGNFVPLRHEPPPGCGRTAAHVLAARDYFAVSTRASLAWAICAYLTDAHVYCKVCWTHAAADLLRVTHRGQSELATSGTCVRCGKTASTCRFWI